MNTTAAPDTTTSFQSMILHLQREIATAAPIAPFHPVWEAARAETTRHLERMAGREWSTDRSIIRNGQNLANWLILNSLTVAHSTAEVAAIREKRRTVKLDQYYLPVKHWYLHHTISRRKPGQFQQRLLAKRNASQPQPKQP